MIIDLSGGTNAVSYPVTYLDSVPTGGWSDEYKTTKMVMCRIPAGTFAMGSPTNEFGRFDNETQHMVVLTKGFFICIFEVTQRQWELVMGNRPSYVKNSTFYATRPVEMVSYYDIRENPANQDDPAVDWPANNFVNGSSFIGKVRTKTGLNSFDLTTEAQWEYACRASTDTALNSGKNLISTGPDANMSEVGRYWYNGGSGSSEYCVPNAGTATVGTYLQSQWGLHDMHGNVGEWCLDWYGAYQGAAIDPVGPATGANRVLRGGAWYGVDSSFGCRSAYRYYVPLTMRYGNVGFRAAMTLP